MDAHFSTLSRIKDILGPQGWTEDQDLIGPHLVEWRDAIRGQSPILLAPANTREAQAVMALCNEEGLRITTQGGNTGLVGAQIPQGEVLITLKRMNQIRSVDPVDDCIVAEAGVILTRVQDAAKEAGKRFPMSLASEGSATIGGLISTNAGGVHVRRHGMMRSLVLGLEAVFPNGQLYEGLSSLRKDNTGYDLKQLFIGAEGTLGLVTAASLKLVSRPRAMAVAMLAIESPDQAVALLHRLEEETGSVAAFEVMNRYGVDLAVQYIANARDPFDTKTPWLALVEFESADMDVATRAEQALMGALEAGLAVDAVVAQNEAQAKSFWYLREEMSACQKPEGAAAKHDVSVALSKVPTFLKAADAAVEKAIPGSRVVAFGHVSDGNIHYDVIQPKGMEAEAFKAQAPHLIEAVHDVVASFGGSISAEHGIGITRRDEFIRREPLPQLAMMRAIKAAFDPKGIMNPRVLL